MSRDKAKEAMLDSNGGLRIGGQIYVLKMGDLIKLILEEAHYDCYSIQSREAKIYHDPS